MNGGFGNTIHVDKLRGFQTMPLHPVMERSRFKSFTSENNPFQREGQRGRYIFFPKAVCFSELSKCRRGLVENRYSFGCKKIVESIRRTADPVRYNQQAAPVQQCSPHLPHRKVKGKGVKQCPGIGMGEAEQFFRS